MEKLKKSDDLPVHLGAFKPVGHVVVALPDEATADRMAAALRAEPGFASDCVVVYSAAEMAERLRALLPHTSGAAGFGSEVESMRVYQRLAEQGCGWLVVYAPEDDETQRVGELARRFGAEIARKYNRLMNEELVQPH